MIRKISSLFLILCLLCSLIGCTIPSEEGSHTESVLGSSENEVPSANETDGPPPNTDEIIPTNASQPPSVVTSNFSTATDETTDITEDTPSTRKDTTSENKNSESSDNLTSWESPPIIEEYIVELWNFRPLSSSKYYQYNTLSNRHKSAYNKIYFSICGGKAIVSVEQYSLTPEEVRHIFKKILADNPQYFYLYSYCYWVGDNDRVGGICLLYSDGTTCDHYGEHWEAITVADRDVIESQIREFNKKTEQALTSMPQDLSVLEKERWIHDYVVENTVYDEADIDDLSLSYTAYGAACNGLAVCKGYTKWFQYLCYCVGINATYVRGVANDTSHCWNAVSIGNIWYMVDVTWDDPRGNTYQLPTYSYFNITTEQISQTHLIDDSNLAVPSCTETRSAFYYHFALYTTSPSQPPENYQEILDRLAESGDKYLLYYTGNLSGSNCDFILQQIFEEDSPLNIYIKQKGYDLKFDFSYYTSEDYFYFIVL